MKEKKIERKKNFFFNLIQIFISCLLFQLGEFCGINYFFNSKFFKIFFFFFSNFVLLFRKILLNKFYFLALYPPIYISILDENFDISLEITEVFDQIKESKAIYQDFVIYEQDIIIFLEEIVKLRNLLENQNDFFFLFKESNNLEGLKFKTPLLEPQAKQLKVFISSKASFILQKKDTIANQDFINIIESTKAEVLEFLISIQSNYIDILQDIRQQQNQVLSSIKESLEFPKREKFKFVRVIRPENLLSDDEGHFFRGKDDVYEEVDVVDPNGRERIVVKRVRPETFIEKISVFFFWFLFFLFF
jgi:hypothetical protein